MRRYGLYNMELMFWVFRKARARTCALGGVDGGSKSDVLENRLPHCSGIDEAAESM